MFWYKHYCGDYMTATMRLTMTEDGAYRRLMDEYYSTETPLPLDQGQLYRAARAFTDEEMKAVDMIVSTYFTKSSDGYHNVRIDEEIKNSKKKSETNRRIAAEREAKRKGYEPLNETSNVLKHETSNETSNKPSNETATYSEVRSQRLEEKKKTNKQCATAKAFDASRFDELWDAYPIHRNKQDALQVFKRRKPDDLLFARMMKAIKEQKKWREAMAEEEQWIEGWPYLQKWLNKKRWEDELLAPEGSEPVDYLAGVLNA